MRFRRISLTLGINLCALAALMLLPALIDLVDNNRDWQAFLVSAMLTFFLGGLLVFSGIDLESGEIELKEGFVLTTLSWLVTAGFSALPFVGLGLSFSDAYLEAMSGLTTTGSTVLAGLDKLPRGILLWRALLQGLGGIGIVVTAIIMLPFLRVGGMQLFHTESSDRSEKVLPRSAQLILAIAQIYAGLIVACALIFGLLGMTGFDAICHALTTVSTGGFSTHDASFAFFKSPSLEWAAVVFMVLGALPFVAMIRFTNGHLSEAWRDAQVRGFVGFLAGVSVVLAIWLVETRDLDFLDALRLATFNVVSITTTTGFANTDYMQWGPFAIVLVFLLTFIGGCAGSTAGGIKIYRFQVAGLLIKGHFLSLMTPHRVSPLRYNGRRLPGDVPFSVIAFLAVYMATVAFFTLLLAGLGIDLITSLSAAATAVSNVGPGLGDTIGPVGSFAPLPDAAKWALSAAMLLGRLELFTVLVLMRPEFWRD
ncbi:MAG: TrkH family potassium uptake protein [Alphaproteobacteria bacterium]|nr:TrkH family potassium uptake protein [Alphaproteobacteria bacterium]